MFKIFSLQDGALSIPALHVMLKEAELHKLGMPQRVYALDADGKPAKVWLQDGVTAPRPVTSFPEWGIEFEKGIVCNRLGGPPPEGPKEREGPFFYTTIVAKAVPNPDKK